MEVSAPTMAFALAQAVRVSVLLPLVTSGLRVNSAPPAGISMLPITRARSQRVTVTALPALQTVRTARHART